MAEQKSIFVDGYRFNSQTDAELARMEQKMVAFFSEKLAGRNAENILTVYDKMLDEKVFSTPIGWEYLRQLQQELLQAGISEDLVRPVPMYISFVQLQEEKDNATVKQRIRPSQKNNMILRSKIRISIIVNIILGVLVIAMFAIAMNGNNPNILNYKRTIEDQYATWEQDLSEREAVMREKEAEISQN